MKKLIAFICLAGLAAGCSQSPPPAPSSSQTSSAPAPTATPFASSSTPLPLPAFDPAQKGRIKPGESVDGLKLGVDGPGMEKVLGKPDTADKLMKNQIFACYYAKGLEVAIVDGKVETITCHVAEKTPEGEWKAYTGATADGLWVGSQRADFEKALGTGGRAFKEAIQYPSKGLWIRFDDAGRTNTVSVKKFE